MSTIASPSQEGEGGAFFGRLAAGRYLSHMQDPTFVRGAFSDIADRYVTTNHVLSMGIDILWREKVASRVASYHPRRLLDVATGSGDLALAIRKRCPGIDLIGSDFCDEMLDQARRRGLHEVLVADALDLPFADASFDVVTVAFGLRNMASYPEAITSMGRVLRPGGRLIVLDFSLPKPPLSWFYGPYLQHVLPRIGGLLTGKGEAYRYLCGSIGSFPSGEAMAELICENGFTSCEHQALSGGIATVYDAVRAG